MLIKYVSTNLLSIHCASKTVIIKWWPEGQIWSANQLDSEIMKIKEGNTAWSILSKQLKNNNNSVRVARLSRKQRANSFGFDSQRTHILGASKGQPLATDLLLAQEFPKCRINEVQLLKKNKNRH